MKLVKMSLAAAVLLGASAFAIDNVKVSGDAKVFYSTNDADYAVDAVNQPGVMASGLFDQGASAADTALRIGATGDLLKGVSFGVTGYAVSTLGLENNLVSSTFSTAHVGVQDEGWLGELWLAATMGKTTAKVGRMELDTPLAFSEKWNIAPNTFEAAVLINQDIPDTTLIGAWVGKGNGASAEGVVAPGAQYTDLVDSGAYAAAIVNNSFKPLTAQAWYYNVSNVADAYWLQADIDCSLVKGVKIGAQYANMDPKGILGTTLQDSSAYAFKLGYEGIENLKVSAAYSDVDNDGYLNVANVATNILGGTSQSKLYTEAVWADSFGYVSAPGAESWNLKASYDVKDIAKFCASYTSVDNDIVGSTHNVDEIAVSVSKSFGPLDAKLAYISTDADDQNNADGTAAQYNTVNAYLTLNF